MRTTLTFTKDDDTGATYCEPARLPVYAPRSWANPPFPAFIQRKGNVTGVEYEAALFDGRDVVWTCDDVFTDRWEALERAAQERAKLARKYESRSSDS